MSIRVRTDEAPPPIGTEQRPLDVVPEPPTPLADDEVQWWITLWRLPVAEVWTPSDGPLIVALAKLYAQADIAITAGIAGQIASIGSQLGLNPRSRAQLRIHVVERKAKVVDGGGRDRFRAVG